MDLGLKDRVAIVTASSKGLGRASAKALLEEGASVVITGRGKEALQAAESELKELGDVLAVQGDVTEKEMPRRIVESTIERFGRLDILVANAGGPPSGRALDVTDEDIIAAVEANLLTSIRLIRAALPHLRTNGWGRICCLASQSVINPMPELALSNTARTGLYAWARTAAKDLVGTGITLNLACPGPHLTDRIKSLFGAAPDGPIGDPEDFGRAVCFLCSDPARYVNGTTLLIDGGGSIGS